MLYSTLDNFFHQFSAMYYWHLKVKFSITFPFSLQLCSLYDQKGNKLLQRALRPYFLAPTQRRTD